MSRKNSPSLARLRELLLKWSNPTRWAELKYLAKQANGDTKSADEFRRMIEQGFTGAPWQEYLRLAEQNQADADRRFDAAAAELPEIKSLIEKLRPDLLTEFEDAIQLTRGTMATDEKNAARMEAVLAKIRMTDTTEIARGECGQSNLAPDYLTLSQKELWRIIDAAGGTISLRDAMKKRKKKYESQRERKSFKGEILRMETRLRDHKSNRELSYDRITKQIRLQETDAK